MGQHKQHGRHMPQSTPHQQPGQQQGNITLAFEYFHNGVDRVIVQFSKPVQNFNLTEQQVDEMINALQTTKEGLIKHRAANGG